MADEILNCDPSEPITKVDWENIVGEKTIDNGGYFGDLLQVSRVHLEDAKGKGELREEDSGAAYSTAIMESMRNAISYGTVVDKSNLELCYLRAQIDKLKCDCDNETALNGAKIELLMEQTESEDKQNMTDGLIDNQIEKMKADILLSQEELEIKRQESDKSYVEMLASIDKVYGFKYVLDNEGNIIRDQLADQGDGKLDYENIMTEKQSELVAQQVLTEVNNTELVGEKVESEDKQNAPDGMIDSQIEKIQADIQIANKEIEIKRQESDKSYVEMLASIDKVYGFQYTLDGDGNIIRDQLVDTRDGKLDYENIMTEKQGELITQQVLTEVNNTELIGEKVESEDKQNMVDGMLDSQIEKIHADIQIANKEIEIKRQESDKSYVDMLASIDKVYGFKYVLDNEGNVIRDQLVDQGDGKMDYENILTQNQAELTGQKKLTEIKNTDLVQEKVESEDKNNATDGLIDKQIEKIDADIRLSEEEIDIKQQNADKTYAEMLASIDKIFGFDYTLDAEGNLIRSSLTPTNDGKYDYENELTQKQALLTEQKTQTESENTEYTREKTESEAMQNQPDGVIEKQIEKIDADIIIANKEIEIKSQESDKSYAEMLATIDKEYGMYYELDANGDIIRSSITSDDDGKMDAEKDLMFAQKDLKVDELLTEQKKRDEMVLQRKKDLLALRLQIFEVLYKQKVIDNMPGIVDDTNPSTIDALYKEVHDGMI